MKAAALYLLVCAIVWGWTFVATKVCLNYVTPIELVGLRFLVGLPALYMVVVAKRLKFEFTRKERGSLAIGSAIITLHFFIQITGLKYTSATNTGWIIAITPLVMALLAFLILKEKLPKRALGGVAIATIGLLVLISRGQSTTLGWLGWLGSIGDWLILASAHTWALYTISIRNVVRVRPPLTVTLAVMLPSGILVLAYMLLTSDWSRFIEMPLDGLLALGFLGLFGMALAHWFWQEGVARIGASRAGIFLYIEPLATTAIAVPYLGEQFGLWTAAGGMMVLAGVFVAHKAKQAG